MPHRKQRFFDEKKNCYLDARIFDEIVKGKPPFIECIALSPDEKWFALVYSESKPPYWAPEQVFIGSELILKNLITKEEKIFKVAKLKAYSCFFNAQGTKIFLRGKLEIPIDQAPNKNYCWKSHECLVDIVPKAEDRFKSTKRLDHYFAQMGVCKKLMCKVAS